MCALTLTSCGQKITSREYEEIVTTPSLDPHDFMQNAPFAGAERSSLPSSMQLPAGEDNQQMQDMLDASVARPPLSWEVPKGWFEKKGSGMRLATFHDQNNTIECSIISLGGQAGGLQSNVVRWMNQINMSVPGNDKLNTFLAKQKTLKTKGGFTITIIDLSELSQDQKSPSMIGAIAELEDKTIFVKMTAKRADIITNRKAFTSLCESLDL